MTVSWKYANSECIDTRGFKYKCNIMQWQDLEKNLKSTCEQFIMSVTKLAVEPMLSFITKVGMVFKLLS